MRVCICLQVSLLLNKNHLHPIRPCFDCDISKALGIPKFTLCLCGHKFLGDTLIHYRALVVRGEEEQPSKIQPIQVIVEDVHRLENWCQTEGNQRQDWKHLLRKPLDTKIKM